MDKSPQPHYKIFEDVIEAEGPAMYQCLLFLGWVVQEAHRDVMVRCPYTFALAFSSVHWPNGT